MCVSHTLWLCDPLKAAGLVPSTKTCCAANSEAQKHLSIQSAQPRVQHDLFQRDQVEFLSVFIITGLHRWTPHAKSFWQGQRWL